MGSNSDEMVSQDETRQELITGTTNNRILFEKWQTAQEELEMRSTENEKLREIITNLQFQVETLQLQMSKLQKKENHISPTESEEYETEEEELAKETEWIRVKHQKTKKRKTNNSQPTSPSTTIPSPTISPKRKVAHPHPKPVNANKTQVPPPIMIEKIESYEELYEMLTNEINTNKFRVKIISENSAKINVDDADSFRAVIQILEKGKHTFHTYENKQIRPIRVMIKELHHTCKPDSIINDLRLQGFEAIGAVNKLSFKKKTPLNMFMVTFDNKQTIEQIYKITNILGCRVKVEAIKGSALIPQCKKCQAFGHTRSYCSRQYRCVKCAGKHATEDCVKEESLKAKCVNCGGDHPASYRGCIVAKELQMIRNKKNKAKQTSPSNPARETAHVNRITTQQASTKRNDQVMSYAEVVATTSNTQKEVKAEASLANSLQLILARITSMENSVTKINEKVNQMEGRLNITLPQ